MTRTCTDIFVATVVNTLLTCKHGVNKRVNTASNKKCIKSVKTEDTKHLLKIFLGGDEKEFSCLFELN